MPVSSSEGHDKDLERYAAGETMPGPSTLNGRPAGGSALYSGRSRVVPAPRSAGMPIYLDRVPEELIRPPVRRSLRSILARRWKLIALITAACLAGSVAYLVLAPPHYRSSAQILVTPAEPDPALAGLRLIGGSEPTRAVQTAVALLDTRAAAARTADRLGGAYTATSVEKAVTVEPRGQSYIISIIADARTPRAATLLADTFARSALDLRNEDVKTQATRLAQALTKSVAPPRRPTEAETVQLARLNMLATTGDPTVSLAATAPMPTGRAGIPAPFTVLLALLFGLVLGVGTAMAWDAARNPRNSDPQWE